MRITPLLVVACSLLGSCGYKPAPKPPGYDSVTTTQADGILRSSLMNNSTCLTKASSANESISSREP